MIMIRLNALMVLASFARDVEVTIPGPDIVHDVCMNFANPSLFAVKVGNTDRYKCVLS